jgi:hypothetical protein
MWHAVVRTVQCVWPTLENVEMISLPRQASDKQTGRKTEKEHHFVYAGRRHGKALTHRSQSRH